MIVRWQAVCLVALAGCVVVYITGAAPDAGDAPQSPAVVPQPPSGPSHQPVLIGNVFPHMTVMAPGVGSASETGIGAMIPWADRLWAVGYVAHIQGSGIGLYEIGPDLSFKKRPESVTGTFANRLVHWESEQVFIGPHTIDAEGNVRTFAELARHRLTATARHLTDPKGKVYFLTMEGKLFEADVQTLETKLLADLVTELRIPKGAQPHFKGAHTAQGRLVVANNTYEEPEFLGQRAGGRLAEWDGTTWTVLEENPFIEVSGKQNPSTGGRYGNTLFAVGWDRASVILRVLHDGKWQRYRLPKGGQAWDHTWNTEWMRIREVQTERYLMDAFGIFYDLPPMVYGGHVWGVRPICTHLRICPDMTCWRGLLVLAGDQTDNAVGQPQSGFWFGNIDDLWRWGKPSGWGAAWWDEEVEAGAVSDPFLMTGFDKKVMHVSHAAQEEVTFTVEVDFLGTGAWKVYQQIRVPAEGYAHHEFPDGYSAHWVRVRTSTGCRATVSFAYN
jgi:hypothetical protein